ncbi:hypothetical protein I5438_01715 [Citrobacter freundii]|uniref:hypothetical protein n=1 Tax=Citrobacter freundii TaxID=546 RepID=UPI0018FF7233|nr:hypothetical protein [Citrobacter freundii]MBJ8975304.1 hypothetical protein [Citrobacter freundii]MBJ9012036.1 hypothetical protein [Citrobacter freundii]
MSKTNKILIGSVSALCIAGTLVMLKVLFNDGGKMVTDWISALSNVLMAGAAVYAALQAKRWFSQLSYTTAFNKAAEILLKIDDAVEQKQFYLVEVDRLKFSAQFWINKSEIPQDDIIQEFQDRHRYFDEKIKYFSKLKHDYDLLKRWPIKRHQIELVEDLIQSLTILHSNITIAYSQTIHIAIAMKKNNERHNSSYLNLLNKSCENFKISNNKTNELYKAFSKGSFNDYFS